jgi:hypothetical protein
VVVVIVGIDGVIDSEDADNWAVGVGTGIAAHTRGISNRATTASRNTTTGHPPPITEQSSSSDRNHSSVGSAVLDTCHLMRSPGCLVLGAAHFCRIQESVPRVLPGVFHLRAVREDFRVSVCPLFDTL